MDAITNCIQDGAFIWLVCISLMFTAMAALCGLLSRGNQGSSKRLATAVSGALLAGAVVTIAMSTGLLSLSYGVAVPDLYVLVGGVCGSVMLFSYGLLMLVASVSRLD